MSRPIKFNQFCWDKQCPEYIEWDLDAEDMYGNPQMYTATSCQKVGQSYDIDKYPDDCIFLNDIKEYEKNWEQMTIMEILSNDTA